MILCKLLDKCYADGVRECNTDCLKKCSWRFVTNHNTFTCVHFILLSPKSQFRPVLHQIRAVSTSHTNRHIRTHGMSALYKWSAHSWCPYIRNTKQTHLTNIQAHIGLRRSTPASKQPNQHDRRLLIFCVLNSLFLNTLSSYDVISYFKLSI